MLNDLLQVMLTLSEVIDVNGVTHVIPIKEIKVLAEECLQMAADFNAEAIGQGVMAYCYSMSTEVVTR